MQTGEEEEEEEEGVVGERERGGEGGKAGSFCTPSEPRERERREIECVGDEGRGKEVVVVVGGGWREREKGLR